jgi:serine/threonine-protein kinase
MPVSSQPDRWHEIDALFQEALDLDPSEWVRFLEDRCGADAELHRAVSELLSADLGSGSFLEASAQELAPDAIARAMSGAADDPAEDRVGERVGAFRIVRPLGRGGMAGVYLAERADGDFEQRVAIKFLRRGLDTDDFVRRFLAERRILSSLEHPNIARLIDGGTTERGLPYLALEYVDGVPITDYCVANRCSIDERLELFIQVARAVQYAHASLVVHRDIKPSNILVTADGQVKLLDFGIAKLLDPEADPGDLELTRTGFRPLTPEYASPEQVRGEPITTASDVYQLGVLLYRLLTGERPYRVLGTGATLESVITSTQPSPPSDAARHLDAARAAEHLGASPARVSRRLRGDLDTIVMKALRKEPERRYATALEMADDVQSHLDGRPITARRESRLYRTGKFLRRHAWVAPVSITGLLLIGAYVFTLIRHGQELEEERNVAQDVQQAFVSFFTAPDSGDVGLGEGRRDLTILQAIQDGTDRVRDDLADRPAARAELFGAMAAVLEDLDEPGEAYTLAVEALELERTLYGDESPEVHETLLRVGGLAPDPDSARVLLERRLELSRAMYGAEDPAIAASLYALAQLDLREGKLEDAVRRLEAAIEIYRSSSSVHPRRLADALAELADNLEPLDRADDAVAAAREGLTRSWSASSESDTRKPRLREPDSPKR